MATDKPSHQEEDYFARQEIETRRSWAEKLRAEMEKKEIEELRKLHWMHCAKCGFEMHPVVFKGMTIEKCPNCDGVFLDFLEFEKLAGKEGGFIKNVLGLFKF
jgi:rubrerythrin